MNKDAVGILQWGSFSVYLPYTAVVLNPVEVTCLEVKFKHLNAVSL